MITRVRNPEKLNFSIERVHRDQNDDSLIIRIPKNFANRMDLNDSRVLVNLSETENSKYLLISKFTPEILIKTTSPKKPKKQPIN